MNRFAAVFAFLFVALMAMPAFAGDAATAAAPAHRPRTAPTHRKAAARCDAPQRRDHASSCESCAILALWQEQ